ncbi:hypothetical protein Scep_022456 [Stephania cephalantha]|uniref:Uncharacterized protein n=1 Tax=Stephania cephalantha TaxID=152367 RepID=A0AAP0I0Z3_9MAGN
MVPKTALVALGNLSAFFLCLILLATTKVLRQLEKLGFWSDQLAIAKETGRRLGMGANMYPSTSLLGEHKDGSISTLPIDELIEKADGFVGVFPSWYSHNFVSCS